MKRVKINAEYISQIEKECINYNNFYKSHSYTNIKVDNLELFALTLFLDFIRDIKNNLSLPQTNVHPQFNRELVQNNYFPAIKSKQLFSR